MALLGNWPETVWPSESIYTLSLQKMLAPGQTDSLSRRGVLTGVHTFIDLIS